MTSYLFGVSVCVLVAPVNRPTVHLGSLSLAIPPWVDAVSSGDGFGHRWGRNVEASPVVHSSVPCDPDCWHAGLSRLKLLAFNLSRPFGRRVCNASLIGSDHRQLDFTVYGSNSTWLDSTRHVRLCRASPASRDERVERDEPCSSNMADDERSCTSSVVFMLLHTQILFVSSNKIN